MKLIVRFVQKQTIFNMEIPNMFLQMIVCSVYDNSSTVLQWQRICTTSAAPYSRKNSTEFIVEVYIHQKTVIENQGLHSANT